MKCRSMGRSLHERKKCTRVSEEKEQKKIKDNILKVFQARLSSPGRGGALLVAEPRTTEKSKHFQQKKHQAVEASTSTDGSSCGSMSGRGRKRTKSLTRRKSRKNTKHKNEEKDTAVAKHLRVAHGITGPSTEIKNAVRSKPTMYSHSRLTQKVGLIRTGTKGELASRGIVVPEHISKQTDEEIRKMSEEAEAEVHMAGDIHVAEKLVLSRVQGSSSERKPPTPATVDRRPQISVPSSVESIKDRQSPFSVINGKFPENLPVEETVATLLVTLKYHTKNLYPGRDYLRETHDELLKLLKQNAPRSATPTRLPVFNTITKSGSVRRPLMESFTDNKRNGTDLMTESYKDKQNMISEHAYSFDEHISMVPKINFADKNPFPAVNDRKGKYDRDIRNSHPIGLSSIKRIREQNDKELDLHGNTCKENVRDDVSLHHLYNNTSLLEHRRKKVQNEIKAYIDTHKNDHSQHVQNENLGSKNQFSGINYFFARSKLVEDDYFFLSSSGHDLKMPKSPILKSHGKLVMPQSPVLSWEATSLLQANEENDCNRDIFEPMEVDTKSTEAVNLLQQNDMLTDRSKQSIHMEKHESGFDRTLDWVKSESRSNSQCSHCSQDSGKLISHVQVPTRQSNYMPSFHGNYYSDHMATGDLSWQQKSSRVKVEAMDILDYADQIGRDTYMDCRGDQNTVLNVSTTPDSPALLGWRAPDTVPHRKTVLPVSPKSPDGPKFYPKKMY